MGLRSAVIVIGFWLAGCTHTPVPPECKTEYAATIDYCPKQRRQMTPKECNAAGGVTIYEDKIYKGCMSQSAANDWLRRRR